MLTGKLLSPFNVRVVWEFVGQEDRRVGDILAVTDYLPAQQKLVRQFARFASIEGAERGYDLVH